MQTNVLYQKTEGWLSRHGVWELEGGGGKAYKGPQGNLDVIDLFTTQIVMRFRKCIHTSKLTKLYAKTGLLAKHSPIKATLPGNCYLIISITHK